MTQRVIKFRAWHNEAKAMLQVGDNHGTTHPLDCAVYARQGQDVVLMLWTGLLDKHRKEIFDKDILSLWCQADPNDYEMKAEVFWNDEQFGWFLKCYHPSGQVSIESLAEVAGEPEFIERIGNIYTTPELVDPKMIEHGNS